MGAAEWGPLAAIGGDSFGAAIALAAAASGRIAETPVFTLCAALDGSLETMFGGGGIERSSTHTKEAFELWRSRIAARHDLNHPVLAAHRLPLDRVPSLHIQAAGHDAWRDDSVVLAEAAGDAGVRVEFDLQPELWHVWHMHTDLPETREAIARVARFVDGA